MLTKELGKYTIKKDGFRFLSLLSDEDINKLEIDFYNRILLQAYKLRIIDNANFIEYPHKINLNLLVRLVLSINKKKGTKNNINFWIPS